MHLVSQARYVCCLICFKGVVYACLESVVVLGIVLFVVLGIVWFCFGVLFC